MNGEGPRLEHVASALHEGLLQDLLGLIMQLQAVADQMAEGDPARAAMDQVLDRADVLVATGMAQSAELREGELPRGS